MMSFFLLAQDFDPPGGGGAGAAAGGMIGLLCNCIALIIALIPLIGMWKTFEKAGKPGWAAIVPFYNMYVLTQIAGKDIMWFLLLLIPCVNFFVLLIILIDFAKAFGKDTGFAIGLWLLSPIFFPILGFGDARYIGPPRPTM